MGEDCVCRCNRVLRSICDSGEDARRGEEDNGDETAGRLSHGVGGVYAKDSILEDGVSA